MTFWTYMLHCADRSFYVGHTDDLERRISEHQNGAMPGYTSERLPVVLVWSQAFEERDEARSAEARIKGWSRAKKLALIRGDWAEISKLSSAKKEWASTSSAKPGWSAEVFLHPHCGTLPSNEYALSVKLRRTSVGIWLRYRLTGPCRYVRFPQRKPMVRTDALWKHTCFELFVKRLGAEAYCEYNFAPSTEWAAYRFDRYREAMADLETAVHEMRLVIRPYFFELSTKLSLPDPIADHQIALSAVIEEIDGTKSYWALRHPPGPPDFHHPDCFALTLAAPG